jgi:general secretion pathway protein G
MKTTRFLTTPFSAQQRQQGMTLIEIIIVVALLGTLMAILVNNLLAPQQEAQRDQAKLQMAAVSQPLNMYRVHHNKYPTTAQGLDALVANPGDDKSWRGPYTEENKLTDPWGKKFDYESDGRQFKMTSSGPDGEVGTPDDVIYPEPAGEKPAAAGESQGSN